MSGTKTSPSPCSRGTYSLKVISIPHFDYLHAGCSEKKQSAMKLLNAEAIGPFKTVTQWNAPLCSLWLRLRAPATDELIATGILLEAWVFCKNSPMSEGVFPEEVGEVCTEQWLFTKDPQEPQDQTQINGNKEIWKFRPLPSFPSMACSSFHPLT